MRSHLGLSILLVALTACGSSATSVPDVRAVDASSPDAPIEDAGAADAVGLDSTPDSGEVDTAISPPLPLDLEACWPGRWCWLEGAPVTALDAASDDALYAADASGRVFHATEAGWEPLPGIAARRALRLYVGPTDVWAITEHVGEEGFFVDRFDGSAWSTSWEDVDPDFLAGFAEHVWVRDGELSWLRFDGSEWRRVDALPEVFGTMHTELLQGHYDPTLLPGPDGHAYAIASVVGVHVPTVVHFDGERWAAMGSLASGWSHLAWEDGELRAVEYHGSSTGSDSVVVRFDGVRWVPVRTAPADRYLAGSARGVVVPPRGLACDIWVPAGEAVLCAAGRSLVDGGLDERPLPPVARPLELEDWPRVPVGFWASGAWSGLGETPNDLLLLRSEHIGRELVRRPERVLEGRSHPVLSPEGRLPFARTVSQVPGEAAWMVADGGLYRVGERAVPLSFPGVLVDDFRPTDVIAVQALPGDEAWTVMSVYEGNPFGVVHVNASGEARLDHEFANVEDFATLVQKILDVTTTPDGDLWLLATEGVRQNRLVLFRRHEDPSSGIWWRKVTLGEAHWGSGQLVAFDDSLYVAFGATLARLPLAALAADAIDLDDYRHALPPGAPANMHMSVRETGVWFTDDDTALLFVEAR